jgi:hypothetical protein
MNCTTRLVNPDPYTLYAVGTWSLNKEYGPYHKDYVFNVSHYMDLNTNTRYDTCDSTMYINENPINLDEIINYSINDKFGVPKSFVIGNGVLLECAYQIR